MSFYRLHTRDRTGVYVVDRVFVSDHFLHGPTRWRHVMPIKFWPLTMLKRCKSVGS